MDRGSECDLIVFGDDLRPRKSEIWKSPPTSCLGRTGLILEIFARRAEHEGKLQVELAQLDHAASRLVRGWSHLDRQRGGSGRGAGSGSGLGGAGETQLEADQRMLGNRIKQINGRLANVRANVRSIVEVAQDQIPVRFLLPVTLTQVNRLFSNGCVMQASMLKISYLPR